MFVRCKLEFVFFCSLLPYPEYVFLLHLDLIMPAAVLMCAKCELVSVCFEQLEFSNLINTEKPQLQGSGCVVSTKLRV